jgi:serine/threonine protein kinase
LLKSDYSYLIKYTVLLVTLSSDRSNDPYNFKDGSIRPVLECDAIHKFGITSAISNYSALAADDVAPAAEFIAACLSLDPSSRPSASDLMHHSWVKDADWCRDYRRPTPRDRPQ